MCCISWATLVLRRLGSAPVHSSNLAHFENVMKVGVARTWYFMAISCASLMSTLTNKAFPCSSARESKAGYAILHGAQVDDVKKTVAQVL